MPPEDCSDSYEQPTECKTMAVAKIVPCKASENCYARVTPPAEPKQPESRVEGNQRGRQP